MLTQSICLTLPFQIRLSERSEFKWVLNLNVCHLSPHCTVINFFPSLTGNPARRCRFFFVKVLKKLSIFFIFLVISCCVVSENVCNRRVNTQGLSLKRFYGLPSVNHYHSSYTNCTITETDSHGLRLLLVKCYDNKT